MQQQRRSTAKQRELYAIIIYAITINYLFNFILGGGECHGLIVWASVTAVKTLLKIKHDDGFELNGVRAL